MHYIVETPKSVADAARDLEAAVKRGGFGVLHVYDLQQTLRSKGVDLPAECRVFEVCNPQQAGKVLAADMSLNMALPCRVSVWENGGRTNIGMLLPTALLGMLSHDKNLRTAASEVEFSLRRMIDEAGASPARG